MSEPIKIEKVTTLNVQSVNSQLWAFKPDQVTLETVVIGRRPWWSYLLFWRKWPVRVEYRFVIRSSA